MSKKKCCCTDKILGEWCDHEHYSISFYDRNNRAYDSGSQEQCKQPNWKTLGTLTTELPSVGHPMTTYICSSAGTDQCCNRIPNADSYLYADPDPNNPFGQIEGFRTSSQGLNSVSYVWGDAIRYGDILPCWFNGLNMTNIENEDDTFFEFTFELKIEKLVGSSYQEIVNTKINGPGKNLRPHPDTVRSYNVGRVDIDSDLPPHIAFYLTGVCNVFFENGTDSEGNPNPCEQDFARMPRGPWPYRFKRHFDVNREDVDHCYNPIDGSPYTVSQVKAAKANPSSVIGTPLENILQCEIVQSDCTTLDGCCTKVYLDKKEFCNQLDDEGTPYGWEDCPGLCPSYTNYPGTNDLNFFGWLDTANRYTTPEWDVIDELTDDVRKVSLHVLVPTAFTGTNKMCDPDWITQGRSFGEWSFGMDYEANGGEIDALEAAGYQWSNGREQDGIWIHKTPTNALRVLFTLDHADLDQGKVWRVFKDWDVEVNEFVKTFNPGTPQESKFKITIKQKVEEKYLSSLGCDCPSGYRQREDGSLERIGPSACDDQIPGFEFSSPNTCSDGNCAAPFLHCMNQYRGTKISFSERGPLILNLNVETRNVGCLICDKDPTDPTATCKSTHGGSSETNEITHQNGIKFIINSNPVSGYLNYLPQETNSRGNRIFSDLGGWPSESNNLGCLNGFYFGSGAGTFVNAFPQFYANSPYSSPQNIPGSVYDLFKLHSERYSGAFADLPFGNGNPGSPMGGKRYRNNYSGVQQSRSSITTELDRVAPFRFYPHLYGDSICTWTSQNCNRTNELDPIAIYEYAQFNIKEQDFPVNAPIGNCLISCECILPGDAPPPNCVNPPGGGGGPVLCPCCNTQQYDGDPFSCDPSPTGCPTDPITGLQPRCGAGGGPQCRCECQIGCQPSGSQPAAEGPYRHPYWACGENVARIQGRGYLDPFWTCNGRWADGAIQPTFLFNQDVEHYLGMDSERIYFETIGQGDAQGFLGNKNCWDSFSCVNPGCVNNPSCSFTYLNEFCQPQTGCNFCLGAYQPVATGMKATFFNWRKYLCQKRTKDGVLPELNAIETLEVDCTVSKSDCREGQNVPPNPVADPCDHLWLYSSEVNTDPRKIKDFMCGVPNSQDREIGIKIKLSKYEIPADYENAWLPWSTKYKPNPARNLIANNRSHIIINARGLD